MTVMNFDLEDGLPKVSFTLKPDDAERFAKFLAECEQAKADAHRLRLNAQALIRRMEILAAAQVTSDRPLTPGCRTPEGCSENGCLGWCDEHKPEVATRCEGCAELRDQLRDLMRQSKAAQIDAENLREVLHRMLEAPTTQISAGWKDAIRQAMSAAVPDSKTPNAKVTGPL